MFIILLCLPAVVLFLFLRQEVFAPATEAPVLSSRPSKARLFSPPAQLTFILIFCIIRISRQLRAGQAPAVIHIEPQLLQTLSCPEESIMKLLWRLSREAVRYILSHNILCGNALTLKKVDAQGQDTEDPIIFAEWEMVTGTMLKRRDFRLDVLMEAESSGSAEQNQLSLLHEGPSNMDYWMTDPETQKPIPKPIREYPLTDYRKVHENG